MVREEVPRVKLWREEDQVKQRDLIELVDENGASARLGYLGRDPDSGAHTFFQFGEFTKVYLGDEVLYPTNGERRFDQKVALHESFYLPDMSGVPKAAKALSSSDMKAILEVADYMPHATLQDTSETFPTVEFEVGITAGWEAQIPLFRVTFPYRHGRVEEMHVEGAQGLWVADEMGQNEWERAVDLQMPNVTFKEFGTFEVGYRTTLIPRREGSFGWPSDAYVALRDDFVRAVQQVLDGPVRVIPRHKPPGVGTSLLGPGGRQRYSSNMSERLV